jgi:hypothetical protein
MEGVEYFEEVETEREHNGYYYSVGTALTLVILGSLCGLRNVNLGKYGAYSGIFVKTFQ